MHCGSENDPASIFYAGDVNHLSCRELAFDFLDAPFNKALLLPRCVVLGVLLEIAMLAGVGNGFNHFRALDRPQLLKLIPKAGFTINRHGYSSRHSCVPECSSCRRRTVRSGPNLMARQKASPPARVVA